MKTNTKSEPKPKDIEILVDLGGEVRTKCKGNYWDGFTPIEEIQPKLSEDDRAKKMPCKEGWRWMLTGEVTTAKDEYVALARWNTTRMAQAYVGHKIEEHFLGYYIRKIETK